MGGVLLGLLVQVGFGPLFLSSTGGNRKEREREREGGRRPLFLVLFGLPRRGEGAATSRGLPSLSLRPMLAQHFTGGSGNPSVLRKNTRITRNHSDVRI